MFGEGIFIELFCICFFWIILRFCDIINKVKVKMILECIGMKFIIGEFRRNERFFFSVYL